MSDNIYDIYGELDKYQQIIYNKKAQLNEAINTNKKLDETKAKLEESVAVSKSFKTYYTIMNICFKLCSEEDVKYKNKRIKFLSKYIEDNIDTIFPLEKFTAEIFSDFSYNKQKAYLKLHDTDGNIRLPHINEGKLYQELLSFSSGIGIAESLGKNKFYMDEVFAASSPEKLCQISILLANVVTAGMQILMIEQKNDIYKDIPRREIRLHKDPISKMVILDSITDY